MTAKNEKGYIALLHDDNFENNLDAAIADTKIEADQLHCRYMYSDINNRKQNLILKFLSAIDNIKSKLTVASDTAFPTIIYPSKSRLIFLNDWEDSFYFSAAFLMLFLFGDGGYLGKRQQLVMIKAWAKWTLQYYSHW